LPASTPDDLPDLSGLRVVERLARRANELDGRVMLAAVSSEVRRVFDLVPSPWITMADSVPAALSAMAEGVNGLASRP
jgi:hypothetical protein